MDVNEKIIGGLGGRPAHVCTAYPGKAIVPLCPYGMVRNAADAVAGIYALSARDKISVFSCILRAERLWN